MTARRTKTRVMFRSDRAGFTGGKSLLYEREIYRLWILLRVVQDRARTRPFVVARTDKMPLVLFLADLTGQLPAEFFKLLGRLLSVALQNLHAPADRAREAIEAFAVRGFFGHGESFFYLRSEKFWGLSVSLRSLIRAKPSKRSPFQSLAG